uniref:Chemosensory protein 20 n=1 Tax=Agrilus planipennis TaxID=224129 RepID=A0A890UV43_AGRPL|nr:chemosensory protein 20 [Agrilus planipennis]
MKVFLLLTALLVVALAAAEDKYTNKYDNIDLDEILNNDRLISGYLRCLLDKGRCTPEGKELKKNLPDALTNGCSKCSERQKDGATKVVKQIYQKRPDDFKALEAKYDPEGIYRKRYDADIKKLGLDS